MSEEKKRFWQRFKKTEKVTETGIPEAWIEKQEFAVKETLKPDSTKRKFTVPGLKFLNQLLAGTMFLLQFGTGFSTLIYGDLFPALIMLLSSYVSFRYLWTTRRGYY